MFDKGIIKCRLSKLSIANCKRFKDQADLYFMFPFTVLVGQNGSGKTTITRAIRLLTQNYDPTCEFFETDIDDGGFNNARFNYVVDNETLTYQHLGNRNRWVLEGNLPEKLSITSIQTKSIVGGIEKSFLYDNIAKAAKRADQVEYVKRQTHKIQQNPQSGNKKFRYNLTAKELNAVNTILDSDFRSIEIIRHKFFSGTWATNILFQNENEFCEYNSGSGEFLVTTLVREIEKASNESIILIDEPEVSLHPRSQYKLVEYLFDAIKRKHVQMIVTTHSEHIVELLPKEAIICLRKNEGRTYIQQRIIPNLAFLEIGSPIQNAKRIIVEDEMAKSIVERVLIEEGLTQIISVSFYPGGASNLKKYTILTYAKTNINSQYILFDGDQRGKDIPNFEDILEKEKTLEYFEKCFYESVGIRSSIMDWGVDANREAGRQNEDQRKKLVKKYLEYYKDNVFFFPTLIPEDIIYDEEYLQNICGRQKLPELSSAKDNKEKLYLISEVLKTSIGNLSQLLVTQFAIRKEESYQQLAKILHEIAERK